MRTGPTRAEPYLTISPLLETQASPEKADLDSW